MNEPIRTAIDLYERSGKDFNATLAQCLMLGEVQSSSSFFCMGWPDGDGGFFVVMLAGSMQECLKMNAGRFSHLTFAREWKGQREPRTITYPLNRHGLKH